MDSDQAARSRRLRELEKAYPRRFVPVGVDVSNWAQVEPLFGDLGSRLLNTSQAMEEWLGDWSELAACLSEARVRRYVAMTRNTEDAALAEEYRRFMEGMETRAQHRWIALNNKYLAAGVRTALPAARYAVWDQSMESAAATRRDENVPLLAEDESLRQVYERVTGGLAATVDGQEFTVAQMTRRLEDPDRTDRQRYWEAIADCRLAHREELDELFDRMVALRTRIATNAGFRDYAEYYFRANERLAYSSRECYAFHAAVERVVVPMLRAMQERDCQRLGFAALRPWDLSLESASDRALCPFRSERELVDKCSRVFHRIDPVMGVDFDWAMQPGWTDFENRKGKRVGGYLEIFEEVRQPFIFLNVTGTAADVKFLVHESGHLFHATAARDEPLLKYRTFPIEMAELASMSAELLAYDHLDVFYQGDDLARARRLDMRRAILVLPWVAAVDAFQLWVYSHPNHTRQERRGCWLDLMRRFGGIEDWSGYERVLESLWHRQWHIFIHPLYYIEYGLAQVGALQVWRKVREEPDVALGRFRKALSLGGSRPVPELWETAGARFHFDQNVLQFAYAPVAAELGLA